MDTQDVQTQEEINEPVTTETEVLTESERAILLRALAENENTRKRGQKDKEDALKFGVSNMARDMIGVADNLRRALENKSENPADFAEALFSGVDLILKDLEGILGRHGVQRIDATGQQFDPHFHQAVFELETDEHTPGTVVQVMQDGYKIQDRLLRPAMVSVAKAKQQGVA